MSAVIRLKKFGTKKRPFYRIVVVDSRTPRDGRTIEELGYYHPIAEEGKQISFDVVKAVKWLKEGARPSDTVRMIFNRGNIKMDNPEVPAETVTG
jgi:small subunit ribosomal protein S16